MLGGEVIGSMPAEDETKVVGRMIKVSLSWLTHNPNHSFFIIGLRVKDASGSTANTDIRILEHQYSYLHSLVKKHADVIYTNDKVKTKDNVPITIKLLVTTRSKITEPKKKAMRKEITKFLAEYAAKASKDELVKNVIGNEMQGEGVKRLHEIVPVAKLEIKKMEF